MTQPASLRALALALGIHALAAASGAAQMPGTPVLQNAFANPGFTAAADIATLGGASTYALAGAWAPGSARFQLSGGIGIQTRSGAPTRTAYGLRANAPLFGSGSSFGGSAFIGYGGLAGSELDSTVAKTVIPVGATIGYRLGLGMVRGFSVYASPIYEWVGRGGGAGNTSVFRGALGLDIGFTSAIGMTLGVELGPTQHAGSGKPSGTAFGAALSYALGGRG
jgi:hypothetical protein